MILSSVAEEGEEDEGEVDAVVDDVRGTVLLPNSNDADVVSFFCLAFLPLIRDKKTSEEGIASKQVPVRERETHKQKRIIK